MGRTVQQPKRQGEVKLYSWDFSSLLATSETISSQSVSASVYSGTDSSPSLIINGAATVSGNIVSQSITAGVVGVVYQLKCQITTSLSQTLQLVSFLVIEPDIT